MFKRATLYLTAVWLMSWLHVCSKLWLWGVLSGLWKVFSVRDVLRAVSRRRDAIPRTHGWLQMDASDAPAIL